MHRENDIKQSGSAAAERGGMDPLSNQADFIYILTRV